MTISRRLRYEVMRRDDFTCRYCHRADLPLVVDHVIPVALGGRAVPENLVTACAECNAGKTSSAPDAPLVLGVSDDALRWGVAMKEAALVQRTHQVRIEKYCTRFYDAWDPHWSLPANWRSTVEQWFSMDIEIELLLDCLEIAFAARGVDWRWKYFCGIVWRRATERQDIARDILTRNEGT